MTDAFPSGEPLNGLRFNGKSSSYEFQPDQIASGWRKIPPRHVASVMLEQAVMEGPAATLRSRQDMVKSWIVGMEAL